MKNINFKKYFGEGLLIVFSVLFALFINKMTENYQTHKQKEIALTSIKRELYRNASIIEDWQSAHGEFADKVRQIALGQNDSLKSAITNQKFLNIDVLFAEETMFDAVLSDTAWETAKTTGIISEFDYETSEKLFQVYSLQDHFYDRTMMDILDLFLDKDTYDIENVDPVMFQFMLRFNELSGQEVFLDQLYSEALEKLNQ